MANIGKRIEWVDVSKGVGIILVVLGHTSFQLRNIIYGCHMPLFFFLSGIVFQREKYDFGGIVKSRFNSLIIPYVFFYLITYFYWLFVEKSMRSFDIEWWQPLLGLFYGSQWHDLMIHNGILWFLPCLFITQILVYLIGAAKKVYVQVGLIVICVFIGLLFKENLPWGINIALVASQFFFVAWLLRTKTQIRDVKLPVSLFSFIILFTVYVLGKYFFHNEVDMAQCIYSNVFLFEIFAYIGIAAIIMLSITLCHISKPIKQILCYLGENSLVIFALHQPVSRIVRFIIEKVNGGMDIQQNILWSLIATAIIILILWPLIIVYNRYCKSFLKIFYIK